MQRRCIAFAIIETWQTLSLPIIATFLTLQSLGQTHAGLRFLPATGHAITECESLVRLGRMVRPNSPGSGLNVQATIPYSLTSLLPFDHQQRLVARSRFNSSSALSRLSFTGHRLALPKYSLPAYAPGSGKAIFSAHLLSVPASALHRERARLELGLDPSRTLP